MRSCWSARTPSSARGCGHRRAGTSASWRRASRSPGPDALGGEVEGVEADRDLGVVALPVPDLQDAVAHAHVPAAPVAVPAAEAHGVGAVASLDRVDGGRAAGRRPARRRAARRRPAAGPRTRCPPAAARRCPPGRPPRASRRAGRRRVTRLAAGRSASGEITRTSRPGPLAVVEQLGAPGRSGGGGRRSRPATRPRAGRASAVRSLWPTLA